MAVRSSAEGGGGHLKTIDLGGNGNKDGIDIHRRQKKKNKSESGSSLRTPGRAKN